jgi:hypothetical protein
MKTNNPELKRAYRAYVQSRPAAGRTNCPSPEEIWVLLRSGGRRRRKARMMDHVTNCSACFAEFEAFLGILRAEGRFIANVQTNSRDRIARAPRSWRRKYAPAFATLIMVVAAVTVLSTRWLGVAKKSEERGRVSGQLRLFTPGTNRALRVPLVFKWEKVPRVEYYIVEIFDGSLLPLWKSPPVTRDFCSIPQTVEKKMRRGTSYFWMLTAIQQDGTKSESSLEIFTLID